METHSFDAASRQTPRSGILAGLMGRLEGVEGHADDAGLIAAGPGFLQRFDPRIKLTGLLALIIAATSSQSLATLALLFGLAVILAALSRISPLRLARQVWLAVLLFTGAIALPAPLLVAGDAVFHLPVLGWPVTLQGLKSAAFLLARAEVSATLAALLILTTPWPRVLKALSGLGVPVAVVALLGMTYRYIFVVLRSASELLEARRSRVLAAMDGAARRRLLVSTLGVLLGKTLALGGDIHMAMLARGYRGEVRLLDDFKTRARDWVFLTAMLAVPGAVLGLQL